MQPMHEAPCTMWRRPPHVLGGWVVVLRGCGSAVGRAHHPSTHTHTCTRMLVSYRVAPRPYGHSHSDEEKISRLHGYCRTRLLQARRMFSKGERHVPV